MLPPALVNPTRNERPPGSPQARDRWSNNLWGSGFNVTAELHLAAAGAAEDPEQNLTAGATNETGGSNWDPSGDPSSATFLTNGSGMALVAYVPREAGTSLLYGARRKKKSLARRLLLLSHCTRGAYDVRVHKRRRIVL